MVRKAFGIYGEDTEGCSLLIETGQDYIACACMNEAYTQMKAFELFHFDTSDFENFDKLFNEVKLFSRLFPANKGAVQLVWSNEKAVCVPAAFYTDDIAVSLLEVMHGITGPVQYAVTTVNDTVVVGFIPSEAANTYAANLQVTSAAHKYAKLLAVQHKKENKQSVHIVFEQAGFTYAVYKEGVLQLMQSKPYKKPEDVLYHLLNALEVLGMAASEVEVLVSGMIDDSSPLYKNLHTYFNHFSFSRADENVFAAEGFKEYPLHYFASFCQ